MDTANAILDGRQELNVQEIMSILPHRYPFLMIDRIVEIERKRLGLDDQTDPNLATVE